MMRILSLPFLRRLAFGLACLLLLHPAVLAERVSVAGMEAHMQALERIAEKSGGNRATGTVGYKRSVAYVRRVLEAAGYEVRVQHFDVQQDLVAGSREHKSSSNVLAALPGQPHPPILLGGHLDSVATGPGINDNGSGVGLLLDYAEALAAGGDARNIGFVFWGAEEQGLWGSSHFVKTLARRHRPKAYLNFDMIASPNPIPMLYGDPALIELLGKPFRDAGVVPEVVYLNNRTDTGAFADAGITVVGYHSGSSHRKSWQQARNFGGTMIAPADRCYHQACDTFAHTQTELNQRYLNLLIAGLENTVRALLKAHAQ